MTHTLNLISSSPRPRAGLLGSHHVANTAPCSQLPSPRATRDRFSSSNVVLAFVVFFASEVATLSVLCCVIGP